jgi:hypothetical protein
MRPRTLTGVWGVFVFGSYLQPALSFRDEGNGELRQLTQGHRLRIPRPRVVASDHTPMRNTA